MTLNRWLALLIALATILFAIGISIEKSETDAEPSEAGLVEGEAAEVEAAEGEAAEVQAAETKDGEGEGEEEEETLLGINLESTPLVVLAVITSLALAAGAWARPDWRTLLTVIAIAMLAFAILDIREVIQKLDEDETGIAALAGLVAALHLAAGGLAWRLESSAGVHEA